MTVPVIPSTESLAALLAANPQVVELFSSQPELLSRWVVISSRTDGGRTLSVVLQDGHTLLSVSHDGAEVVESKVLLTGVDGTIPKLYWTAQHRTAHAFLILNKIDPARTTRVELSALLDQAFDPVVFDSLR